jgi:hypothetical protein
MVYHLLGWNASALGGRICVGVIHPDELAAREFVLFALPSGPELPVLSSLCWRCAALWERLFHRCLTSRMFISLAVGGERAEPWLRLPHGLVPASSSSIRRKKDDHQPCEGGELRLRGPGQTASTTFRRAPISMAWMVLSSPP